VFFYPALFWYTFLGGSYPAVTKRSCLGLFPAWWMLGLGTLMLVAGLYSTVAEMMAAPANGTPAG
jgi:hypothetical protein